MPKPLVIVESPAKARTIAGFLGDDYVVESSVGHIRDLPAKGLGDRRRQPLQAHLRGARVQEGRDQAAEGAAQGRRRALPRHRRGSRGRGHLLAPPPGAQAHGAGEADGVPRDHPLGHRARRSTNSRDIDEGLVDAQETRRILDRLYGYQVSEVLWRKVNAGPVRRPGAEPGRPPGGRAGAGAHRVPSPPTTGTSRPPSPPTPRFTATLVAVDGQRVATGKDFDDSGQPERDDVVVLDEPAARALATASPASRSRSARSRRSRTRSKPKPPFITSTLQQEGGRKLRMSAAQVMRVAQDLYQNGYITYMRTDSTTLSETALTAARSQVRALYGRRLRARRAPHLRPQGQERPGGPRGHPPGRRHVPHARLSCRGELRGDELRLYELIWKRTVASQMVDARGQLGVGPPRRHDHRWARRRVRAPPAASITFPGYLRAYVEGADDPDAELDDRETLLPALAEGEALPTPELEAKGHTTSPPARFTEASLVKRLEELGIGRPSTYASIMQTIQDRGYVWKKGTALVPTWTAFAVITAARAALRRPRRLRVHRPHGGRARRDRPAARPSAMPWLNQFWFGDDGRRRLTDDLPDVTPGSPGLKALVERGMDDIDPAEINVVRRFVDADGEDDRGPAGRYGPYLKRGERHGVDPRRPRARRARRRSRPSSCSTPPAATECSAPIPRPGSTWSPRPAASVPTSSSARCPRARRSSPRTSPRRRRCSRHDLDAAHARRRPPAAVAAPASSAPTPPTASRSRAQNGRYGPYLKKGTTRQPQPAVARDRGAALHVDPRRGAPDPGPAQAAGRGQAAAAAAARARRRPRRPRSRSSSRTAASAPTSPTARPTPRCARATSSRPSPTSGPPSCSRPAATARRRRRRRRRRAKKKAPAKKKAAAKKKAPAKKAPAKKAAAKKAANAAGPVADGDRPDDRPRRRHAAVGNVSGMGRFIVFEGGEGSGKSTQAAPAGRAPGAPCSPASRAGPRSGARCGEILLEPARPATSTRGPRRC